jgi:hypothetical protein
LPNWAKTCSIIIQSTRAKGLAGVPQKGALARPFLRADDEIRTRDPHLGKVMLYQLSHIRMGNKE